VGDFFLRVGSDDYHTYGPDAEFVDELRAEYGYRWMDEIKSMCINGDRITLLLTDGTWSYTLKETV
jgi:cupin superfamily acireductone dioxygenase involved in methionine salvage